MREIVRGVGLALGALLFGLANREAAQEARAEPPAPRAEAGPREFDQEGLHVRVDPANQVIGVDAPEDVDRVFFDAPPGPGRREVPPQATLAADREFVSGSVLAHKAKQFDDGLYAAVELAAQAGAGRFPGKAALLGRLARTLAAGPPEPAGNARAVLLAACRLGGIGAAEPPELKRAIDAAVNEFLAATLRSKPIGFYTWSAPLSAIFRQDRMLQTELTGAGGIAALARALRGDPAARAAYEANLALAARLTNPPPAGGDLRGPLRTLDDGGSSFPSKGVAFWPPSRAHESDLLRKLVGNAPIPEGFRLVDEMVRRVRSGEIDLTPAAGSGWYDYQTWAIEPLAAPERAAEAPRLALQERYRKQLEELFRGILALTRESHVKHVEILGPSAAPPDRVVKIQLRPELSAEPLATYYARRAASYRFVRTVLEGAFGAEAIHGMRRQTASGPVASDLASELETMEAIFAGAAVAVSRELGLAEAVSAPPAAASSHTPESDLEAFRRWVRTMNADPDLGRDARMMVPVFFDPQRKKTRVWVFLGWSYRPVVFSFARPPAVVVTRGGRPANPDDYRVEHEDTYRSIAYPVTAEVYVAEVLERDAFRRHCDRYKTPSAILQNLR